MQITKCDRCGMEIAKTEKKFKVTIEEKTCLEEDEVIDDLCGTCRFQLREFFHPTEPVPVLFNTDKVRKEAEEDFWASHDPSGGDLPPKDDEKPVGGMKWITEKKKAQARQQADQAKEAAAVEPPKGKRKIDYGKIQALHNAGWTGRAISEEMGISQGSISNILKRMREREEKAKENEQL